MPIKKYIRRNIYKWHRITSLLIALPVLLWTISGFLHPVMNSFKPDVKNSSLPPNLLDTSRIIIPLKQGLEANGIDSFRNFRIVKLYNGFYYQVQHSTVDSFTYINCESGNILADGDKHYASYLAERFLSEENGRQKAGDEHHHRMNKTTVALIGNTPKPPKEVNKKAKISSVKLLTTFNSQYKASNRILPVYEVSFIRGDGIRLYIETGADRLTFAADNNKRWFSSFFSITHSWSFLNGLGKIKPVLIGTFSALCFLSSVFGFFVYNVLKRKKASSAGKRWHRIIGNVFLITTLLYAFSGAWHAFAKLPAKPVVNTNFKTTIATKEAYLDLPRIFSLLAKEEKCTNVSIVKINDSSYWQVFYQKENGAGRKYINTKTYTELSNGDKQYSASLVAKFKSIHQNEIETTRLVTGFSHSYSMMNKRLPVMENRLVNGETVYIETSTGSLAAITRPSDKAERFSFSNLHMHHYWEMWLGKQSGKTVKNIVLISTTLGLLLLALTGMAIYFKKRLR